MEAKHDRGWRMVVLDVGSRMPYWLDAASSRTSAFSVPDNSVLFWQSSLSAHATVIAAGLTILIVVSMSAMQNERWRQLTALSPADMTASHPADQPFTRGGR
jgi:prolipoprotein diacylglyceryltransferase